MTQLLKQSTAVVVSFGPFVDKTDGVTEETGLVSALDHGTTGIKLSKNGGALTIRHASVTASTYDTYGNYLVTLDTTDTNTLGRLRMQFNETATCLPVWQDFMVVPANIYDSLVGGSDLIDVSVTQWLGQAVAAVTVNGVPEVDVTHIGGSAVTAASGIPEVKVASIAANAITATAINADAITNAKIADDAIAVENLKDGAITAAKIATGAIDADALATDAAQEIADALLDRSAGVETGLTVRQWFRLAASALFGKVSGAGGATTRFRDVGDTKDRITATVDTDGNRTAVTRDAT